MFNTLTRMGASNPSGYEIEKSLRFNNSDSAYLSRTPSSAGNRKTFTLSFWFKPTPDVNGRIFEAGSGSGYNGSALYYSDEKFGWIYDTGPTFYASTTNNLFRDCSAWYHVCFHVDTTQGTADERLKVYVNSEFNGFNSYPPQNLDFHLNNNIAHSFGRRTHQNDNYISAYFAEIHFIDGSIVTPYNFAETDTTTGQWIPKEYEGGNYGTNGFYLNFSDNSDTTATTLGKDYSGQGNNWTPNNFSVAAGTGDDSSEDTPTNNYCTLNSQSHRNLTAPTNGQLDLVIPNAAVNHHGWGTFEVTSGKWYWECTYVATSHSSGKLLFVGIGNHNDNSDVRAVRAGDGELVPNTGTIEAEWTTGDIVMVALDYDNSKWYLGKNGSWFLSGDPVNGTGYVHNNLTSTKPLSPKFYNATANGNQSISVNFGARGFTYTPPTGFKALCTKNLPTPTIKNGTDYFNTVLYTGNDGSQNIDVGFQPSAFWVKNRDSTYNHAWTNFVTNTYLYPNLTDDEGAIGSAISQLSNGFNLDTTSNVFNNNGDDYVAWAWKESATAGFDIVSFTPSSGTNTYSHGLGVKPDFIIFKSRESAANWDVYSSALTAEYKLYLNDDSAKIDSGFMSDTEPTSSVFSFNPGNQDGNDHIAYCFSNVKGYLKAGSYTGNANANGPFVYTGFKPAMVFGKDASGADNWWIFDNKRNTSNVVKNRIFPSLNNVEGAVNADSLDFVSNGFKIRGSGNFMNENNNTFVYIAFAETPFKYATAR